jgi:hypothetical protein
MHALEQWLAGSAAILWRGLIPRVPPEGVRLLARALFSRSWRRFEEHTRRPAVIQAERLHELVLHQRDTAFGREHGYARVRGVRDFQRQVPVRAYDALEPYLQRMTRGEQNVLVPEPVRYFARTSGTTGAAKYIPVTDRFLEEFRTGRRVWLRQVAQAFPDLVRGTILTMHSPRIEGRTEAGIPYGSITVAAGKLDQGGSGLDGGATGRANLLGPLQRIPMGIFHLEDFDTKYYVLLRVAVATEVSLMAAINPSTLVLMCRKLTEFAPRLIEACEHGGLGEGWELPGPLAAELEQRLGPAPAAADRLRASLSAHGRVRPIDVWPRLSGLLCWKGGSAPFYLRQFPEWFGGLRVMDYGYAATEGNFSVTMGPEGEAGVLAVGGHFLEFLPEEADPARASEALTAEALEVGKRYRVLVTGAHGLARYDIQDVVEVVGRHHATPQVVFRHKAGNMVSFTGEKIGESHVVQAVSEAQERTGHRLQGFCVTVRLDAERPRYVFAVEPAGPLGEPEARRLLEACEQGLRRANIEYQAKRASQRLGPPLLAVIAPGAFERWRQARIREGAPDAHVKVPHLAADPGVLERLGVARVVEGAEA